MSARTIRDTALYLAGSYKMTDIDMMYKLDNVEIHVNVNISKCSI